MRVALVTGASRGIGAAAAVALGRRGWHVVLTARTQGGLEETDDAVRAAGGTATLLPLDLAAGAQVDAIGPSLHARFGRLDALVHAAGVLGKLTPTSHIMDRDWEGALAVNLGAAMRLIRTAAPLLEAAPAGRAVFVADARAATPRAYWGTYGATKAAMEHLVRGWAAEAEGSALGVTLYDPGPTRTRLRAAAYPGEDPTGLPGPETAGEAIAGLCDLSGTGSPVQTDRTPVSA
jgi:NAD(P)-dependent dehydrogenase (short-subunit alcohol dehydrogenase family)